MEKQYLLTISNIEEIKFDEAKKIKKDSHINNTIKKKNSQAFNNARIDFTVPSVIKHRVLDIKSETGGTITDIMRDALNNGLTSYEEKNIVTNSEMINKATCNERVASPRGQMKG